MTRKQYNEELALIASLTDEEVRIIYNVDERHEALEYLNSEFDDEDEEPEEEYFSDYYRESAEESRFYDMRERRMAV